jgi:hypothetical protein
MAHDTGQPVIVDAFPAFLSYWERARHLPIDEQIERWACEAMAGFPELLAAQLDDRAKDGLDWRALAREHVFSHLAERLPAMTEAHDNLLQLCAHVLTRAQQVLDWPAEVTFVIYVGVGSGAGWATRYAGQPAVLLGLENIAECGWSNAEALRGLLAHELAHLAFYDWRAQAGVAEGGGPWWDLYEEGFADYAGQVIDGSETFHEAAGPGQEEWLSWCRAHEAWLAAEYLRCVDEGGDRRVFFGSWFQVAGHSQTGYYLGQRVVSRLAAREGLRPVALLAEYGRVRATVEELAMTGVAGVGKGV